MASVTEANVGIWDKETILVIVNAVLALGGFIGSFMLSRLMLLIKKLEDKDKAIEEKLTHHREDVLKNYVTSSDLDSVKHDIIDRIDRFEKTLLAVSGRRIGDRS